jgi:hypothetical protein
MHNSGLKDRKKTPNAKAEAMLLLISPSLISGVHHLRTLLSPYGPVYHFHDSFMPHAAGSLLIRLPDPSTSQHVPMPAHHSLPSRSPPPSAQSNDLRPSINHARSPGTSSIHAAYFGPALCRFLPPFFQPQALCLRLSPAPIFLSTPLSCPHPYLPGIWAPVCLPISPLRFQLLTAHAKIHC